MWSQQRNRPNSSIWAMAGTNQRFSCWPAAAWMVMVSFEQKVMTIPIHSIGSVHDKYPCSGVSSQASHTWHCSRISQRLTSSICLRRLRRIGSADQQRRICFQRGAILAAVTWKNRTMDYTLPEIRVSVVEVLDYSMAMADAGDLVPRPLRVVGRPGVPGCLP